MLYERTSKTVSDSRVVLAEVIEPTDANFLNKAFGGAILSKIDLCAYATATKFSGTISVTASFDRVDFHEPIEVGELVTLEGTITFVGRTSMEVTIEVYADNLRGKRRHTNTARVMMVALHDGKPVEVPMLVCESRDDMIRFLTGRARKERKFVHKAEFEAIVKGFEASTDTELQNLINSSST